MARPYWSGQIVISLVSFSVKLFVATEARSQIAFHQIDRATGQRVKYRKTSASKDEDNTLALANGDIVKGYEYRPGQYITLEPSELANLRVPSKHSLAVTQFVDAAEIDPEFFEKPYFAVPEDDSQTQAFAVVRQALKETKKVALSKIAFAGREHPVALFPAEPNGMVAYTLRFADELRPSADYFRDIKPVEIDDDSLDLAKQLIQRRSAKFDPAKFVDGYEVALKELVQAKIDHAPLPRDQPAAAPRGKVVSLMDALRKSIGEETALSAKRPSTTKGPTLVAKPAKAAKRKSA